MNSSNTHNYPLFEHWYKTNGWLLERCDAMPKHTRFTINGRIANVSIDIMELLIEAIYSKEKIPFLQKINLKLEKLRIFFRLCTDRHYISIKQYEYIIEQIDTAGRMCGGWLKQCKE